MGDAARCTRAAVVKKPKGKSGASATILDAGVEQRAHGVGALEVLVLAREVAAAVLTVGERAAASGEEALAFGGAEAPFLDAVEPA